MGDLRQNVKKITVRLTRTEYAHLQKQVQSTGLKMEPLLRKLIMGTEIKPRPPDVYSALLRELSAIGNNINQIAHWANARQCINRDEIRKAAELVQQAWNLIKDTL